MNQYITIFLLLGGSAFSSGFDDAISIGEKVKVKHMATTHSNGIVGDTLYVYEADKREVLEDNEGILERNAVYIDAKTLRKNRDLKVTQIEESVTVKRVSGKTKNRTILKSQEREKQIGVSIGSIDLSGSNIKNVKTYRRNNHYTIGK